MESDSLALIIVILSVLFSALFSGASAAYQNLSRSRIKTLAGDGNKKAKSVLKLLDNLEYLNSLAIVASVVLNILSAALLSGLVSEYLFTKEPNFFIPLLISAAAILLICEIFPKSVAVATAEKTALKTIGFIQIFVIIFAPFAVLMRAITNLTVKIFKTEENKADTEEELLSFVEEAEEEGEFNEQESTLIRSAIEFSEQEAIDVLTPRIDIEGVSEDATKEEIAKIFAETGYSRLPLYHENIDHITGIIYLKDFYNKVFSSKASIKSIVRPAIYTTQNKKINELLKELQVKKLHIAVVLDEYGSTMGIVTLEDILEELVGEIWDEHDEVTEEIVTSRENEYIVLGSTNIEEMFEELDIKTDEEFDVQTVSGWVMNMLGQIPKEGDTFEVDNLSVIVTEMDEKRVEKIKVTVTPKEVE